MLGKNLSQYLECPCPGLGLQPTLHHYRSLVVAIDDGSCFKVEAFSTRYFVLLKKKADFTRFNLLINSIGWG